MERDVIGAMRTAFEQSADRIVAAGGKAVSEAQNGGDEG